VPFVEESRFLEALQRVADLREAGSAWLLTSVGGATVYVSPSVATDEIEDALEEIAQALDALIDGDSPTEFAERRSSRRRATPSRETEAEDLEVAKRKLDAVASTLPIEDLRRRHWVKRTSKADTPAGIEWELSAKHRDEGERPPGGRPVLFGTLRLESHQPVGSVFGGMHRDLALTLDLEDVRFFRSLLGDLEAALTETGSAEDAQA
jgi:hypothetical protein